MLECSYKLALELINQEAKVCTQDQINSRFRQVFVSLKQKKCRVEQTNVEILLRALTTLGDLDIAVDFLKYSMVMSTEKPLETCQLAMLIIQFGFDPLKSALTSFIRPNSIYLGLNIKIADVKKATTTTSRTFLVDNFEHL